MWNPCSFSVRELYYHWLVSLNHMQRVPQTPWRHMWQHGKNFIFSPHVKFMWLLLELYYHWLVSLGDFVLTAAQAAVCGQLQGSLWAVPAVPCKLVFALLYAALGPCCHTTGVDQVCLATERRRGCHTSRTTFWYTLGYKNKTSTTQWCIHSRGFQSNQFGSHPELTCPFTHCLKLH